MPAQLIGQCVRALHPAPKALAHCDWHWHAGESYTAAALTTGTCTLTHQGTCEVVVEALHVDHQQWRQLGQPDRLASLDWRLAILHLKLQTITLQLVVEVILSSYLDSHWDLDTSVAMYCIVCNDV